VHFQHIDYQGCGPIKERLFIDNNYIFVVAQESLKQILLTN